MYFNLKGYKVTSFEPMNSADQTRATETENVTDNLMLGVFDKNGKQIGEFTVQNKDDENFGTFAYTLTYGTYTVLALGWNGTATCNAKDINNITFSDNAVPQTFMCRQNIVVSESYSDTRTLTLKRCVTNLYISLKDSNKPVDLAKYVIEISGAGNALNSETGFCAAVQTFTKEIIVPAENSGKKISVYNFLPAKTSNVTYKLSAIDSEGNAFAEHTFTDIEMKINYQSIYSGYLYSYPANGNLEFDFEYEGTTNGTF